MHVCDIVCMCHGMEILWVVHWYEVAIFINEFFGCNADFAPRLPLWDRRKDPLKMFV